MTKPSWRRYQQDLPPPCWRCAKSCTSCARAESDAARRMDILAYQINEIEAAHLQPGEEEELRAERNRLANAEGPGLAGAGGHPAAG